MANVHEMQDHMGSISRMIKSITKKIKHKCWACIIH